MFLFSWLLTLVWYAVVFLMALLGLVTLGSWMDRTLTNRRVKRLASAWSRTHSTNSEGPAVVIVGGGFSGLLTAIRLKQAGIPFVLFEKASGPGGVWRSNTYPGAACDVHAPLYSFSFEPNPEWPSAWPAQADILRYIEGLFDKYELQPHCSFNTPVTAATWNERTGSWRVEYTTEQQQKPSFVECKYFVVATGQLSVPKYPSVDFSRFKGPCFHSGEWDHGVDLSNKRVLCVGAGASAVQLVPQIAKRCSKLLVLQRTPSYVALKGDFQYPPWLRFLFRHVSPARLLYRFAIYMRFETMWPAFLRGSWLNRNVQQELSKQIECQIPPDQRQEFLPRVLPADPVGCRRILIADEWYSTLLRPNVELVNGSLTQVNRHTVVVRTTQFDTKTDAASDTSPAPPEVKSSRPVERLLDVDVIVCASGFDTNRFTGGLAPHIRGMEGTTLGKEWSDGDRPYAYQGITVPKFPNLFLMYGPNTNLGHNSILIMLETQVNYIIALLTEMLEKNCSVVEVRRQTAENQQRWMQEKLSRTVWAGGCTSWYKTPEGVIVNNWGSHTLSYMYNLWNANPKEYVMRP